MVQLASHSTFCSSSRRISSSAAEIFSPVFVMAAASYHAAELLLAVSHLQPGTPLCPENQLQALLAGGCHKQPPAVEVRPNFPQGRETVGEHGPLRVFLDPNS